METNEIIIFKTEDENISVDVRYEDETVWLTQEQMATLFDKAKSTISEHIKHIFEDGELDEKVVVRNFRITTKHGAIEGKTQEKTEDEYKKYQQKTLSEVEKSYLDSLKQLGDVK